MSDEWRSNPWRWNFIVMFVMVEILAAIVSRPLPWHGSIGVFIWVYLVFGIGICSLVGDEIKVQHLWRVVFLWIVIFLDERVRDRILTDRTYRE